MSIIFLIRQFRVNYISFGYFLYEAMRSPFLS